MGGRQVGWGEKKTFFFYFSEPLRDGLPAQGDVISTILAQRDQKRPKDNRRINLGKKSRNTSSLTLFKMPRFSCRGAKERRGLIL